MSTTATKQPTEITVEPHRSRKTWFEVWAIGPGFWITKGSFNTREAAAARATELRREHGLTEPQP